MFIYSFVVVIIKKNTILSTRASERARQRRTFILSRLQLMTIFYLKN